LHVPPCACLLGGRHGSWQSVAKLQSHFGLDKKPDVNRASFRAAFAAAAEEGLNPRDFEFEFQCHDVSDFFLDAEKCAFTRRPSSQ
jgi:hypothetical protein